MKRTWEFSHSRADAPLRPTRMRALRPRRARVSGPGLSRAADDAAGHAGTRTRRTRGLVAAVLAATTLAAAACTAPGGHGGSGDGRDGSRANTASGSHAGSDAAGCAPDTGDMWSGTAAESTGYMAATTHPRATEAACRVLAAGGTAADAAVAAQAVLGLVEPQSSGPGGGALAVYRDADGRVSTYDATVHSLADDSGLAREAGRKSAVTSVGVPQTLRLLRQLNADHGSTPLPELVDRAVELGDEGFEVSPRLVEAMEQRSRLFEDTDLLHTDTGNLPHAGDTVRNRDYAAFLRDWAAEGMPRARDIAADLSRSTPQRARGYVDALAGEWADEAAAELPAADPLCTDYRDRSVCGTPSTATGNMVVAETLGILDHRDVARTDPYENSGTPVAMVDAAQRVIEAERISFADANTWMADPAADPDRARAFRERAVADPDYLHRKAESIRADSTLPDPKPVRLAGHSDTYRDFREEGTAQISVVDSSGAAVSMTTTLQRNFGSGISVHGFFLNNSLDNFSRGTAAGRPNARADATRPKTMMAPLLVLGAPAGDTAGAPAGETAASAPLEAVVGSPGGSKIPAYNVKAVLGLVDWQLDPRAAVAMPNFGAVSRSRVFIEDADLSDQRRMRDVLRDRGQDLDALRADSGLAVIGVGGPGAASASTLRGAGDPRRGGAAAGGG